MSGGAEYDFVIIGSGFGGSVSAMRLAQKGYRVAVLEEGREWKADNFPRTNWNVRRYLWAPRMRCFGIQAITLLRGLMLLHGKGVGGGSLVYANTLMTPHKEVFTAEGWPKGVDWWKELEPHYEMGRRMLGVTRNPLLCDAEKALRVVGREMGVENTFHATEVGVFFGEPEKTVPDPYFSGAGPERTGCRGCGGCMVGCQYGAKNTLDRNYLYFARKLGARIFPETKATVIRALSDGYEIRTERRRSWWRARGETFRAKKVIVAAGVLGTVELLLRNRDESGTLPEISKVLGLRVRTNGESLLGATSLRSDRDFSQGIAIGAAFHPDGITKIEAVKYPSGSSFLRLLAVPLTPDGSRWGRPFKFLLEVLKKLPEVIRLAFVWDWARRSVILLVMQSSEAKMLLYLRRGLFGSKLGGRSAGEAFPSYLELGQQAVVKLAREIRGVPQNVVSEVLLATPATAHILGGCCLAEGPAQGVVGMDHEVFGSPGLYVCDGSVIPVNLGVNPSLTIVALAERFAAGFPARTQAEEIRFSSANQMA